MLKFNSLTPLPLEADFDCGDRLRGYCCLSVGGDTSLLIRRVEKLLPLYSLLLEHVLLALHAELARHWVLLGWLRELAYLALIILVELFGLFLHL